MIVADRLKGGNRLNIGDSLLSANGRYQLNMQGDGNLVLYETGNFSVWNTHTSNQPPNLHPAYCEMQTDGNLVLLTAGAVPIWASGTNGHDGAYVVLQDDRNLVVYAGDVEPNPTGHGALWASGTYSPPLPAQITRHADQEVGYKKHMTSDAILYNNGQLEVTTFTKNDNWTGGLRGRVFVMCVDYAGRASWISEVFECATRCSLWDPSCASYGQQVFGQKFPDAVGQVTRRLDIYQADDPNFVNLQQKLKEAIKTAKELAPEIMAIINLL